jgi:hypothetical protein
VVGTVLGSAVARGGAEGGGVGPWKRVRTVEEEGATTGVATASASATATSAGWRRGQGAGGAEDCGVDEKREGHLCSLAMATRRSADAIGETGRSRVGHGGGWGLGSGRLAAAGRGWKWIRLGWVGVTCEVERWRELHVEPTSYEESK